MTDFKLKPGINDCTNEEYHGDKNYLSSSNLKLLLKDTEKFKTEFIEGVKERKQVNAFDEGSYAHALILEPHVIEDEFAFYSGFRKSGKAWEEFKRMHDGKIILSKPQKHRVEKWVESYNERSEAISLVSGGVAEQSIVGTLNDVPIKVRADYVNVEKGYIADVKTTAYSPDVDSFKQVIDMFSYDLSAALYCQMFEQYYNKPFDFYFIVLGKKDHICEVYKMSDTTMNKGKLEVSKALKIYKECKEKNDWTNNNKKHIIESKDYEILEV